MLQGLPYRLTAPESGNYPIPINSSKSELSRNGVCLAFCLHRSGEALVFLKTEFVFEEDQECCLSLARSSSRMRMTSERLTLSFLNSILTLYVRSSLGL